MRFAYVRGIVRVTAHGSTRVIALFSPATVAVLAGLVLMGYGLHEIYAPLAPVIIGAGCLTFGLWLLGVGLPRRGGR